MSCAGREERLSPKRGPLPDMAGTYGYVSTSNALPEMFASSFCRKGQSKMPMRT